MEASEEEYSAELVEEGHLPRTPPAPPRTLDSFLRASPSLTIRPAQSESRAAAKQILSSPGPHQSLVLSSKAGARQGPTKRKAGIEADDSPVPTKKIKREAHAPSPALIQKRISQFPGEGFEKLGGPFPLLCFASLVLTVSYRHSVLQYLFRSYCDKEVDGARPYFLCEARQRKRRVRGPKSETEERNSIRNGSRSLHYFSLVCNLLFGCSLAKKKES